MIARLWHGYAANDKANGYVEHLQHTVFPELNQIEGYQGAYVLRRVVDNDVEFAVLTLWKSMEAIRKFAGANPEKAVVAPAAQTLLHTFDSTVTHYEIVLEEAK